MNWFNRFTKKNDLLGELDITKEGPLQYLLINGCSAAATFVWVRETLLSSVSISSEAYAQLDNSSNSSENKPECYTLQWNYRRLCAGHQAVIPPFAAIIASVCLGRPFSMMFEHGCRALLQFRHKSISEVWRQVCFAIQFISKLFSEFKSGVCAGQSSFFTIDSVNRPCFVHRKIE